MRTASLAAGLFLLAVVSSASAQTPECAGYVANAQRVCAAAVDGTRAFHPIVGVLVSGGNPTIGTAGTLGGLGHASFTLRANAVELVLPDLSYNGSSSTVPAGSKIFAPAPLVEGSLGLYKGMPAGLFAVDFLGSAQLLPTNQIDNLVVESGARKLGTIALGLGYGARIGILREMGPLADALRAFDASPETVEDVASMRRAVTQQGLVPVPGTVETISELRARGCVSV